MTIATPELTLRSVANDWTLARWETLPADGNRYEVLDGVLYMTTAPSAFHQWIAQQVLFFLHRKLVGLVRPYPLPSGGGSARQGRGGVRNPASGGILFMAPIGLVMPGSDPAQPDLRYLRPEDRDAVRDRRHPRCARVPGGVPALIVEVLSPSNPELDLVTKRRGTHPQGGSYAGAGVPEYWIARPATRDLLLLSDPDPQRRDYMVATHIPADGELASPTLPLRTPLARFFADAPDTTL